MRRPNPSVGGGGASWMTANTRRSNGSATAVGLASPQARVASLPGGRSRMRVEARSISAASMRCWPGRRAMASRSGVDGFRSSARAVPRRSSDSFLFLGTVSSVEAEANRPSLAIRSPASSTARKVSANPWACSRVRLSSVVPSSSASGWIVVGGTLNSPTAKRIGPAGAPWGR